MSRIYTVPFSATVTAAGGNTDLWTFVPADDKPIKLLGFLLSQISEVGDAQEEGLEIQIIYSPATFTDGGGTGSTSVTPVPVDPTDTAAGFTSKTNSPTVSTTSGSNTVGIELGWNERNSPYEWWAPDTRLAPKQRQAGAIVIRMATTLADDMTFVGTAWVEEE